MIDIRNVISLLVLTVLTVGCASINPFSPEEETNVKLEMVIEAAHDVNPDTNGVPSPIELRLYQLNSLSEFEQADFFTLYNEEPLQSTLLDTRIFLMSPSQLEELKTDLKPDTQYIAIIAAYQDIDNAVWKDVIRVRDSRGFLKKMISSQKVMTLHALALTSRVLLTDQE
jgi:type VI secretion system protein VasD